MYETDASQQSEHNNGINDVIHTAMSYGNGGAELVLAPVIFGFAGFLLEGALGFRPLLTILGVLIGLGGAAFNQYFRYTKRMAQVTAERKAAFVAEHGESTGPSFGAVEREELPSYVLESDLDSIDHPLDGVRGNVSENA